MTNAASTSTVRFVALLVFAYALLGAIGLILAIPPGFASPVFPASGFALACVLLYGRRALPGIWGGSFLLNFVHGRLAGPIGAEEAAINAAIATGAALGAWCGAALIRSGRGNLSWQTLENEKDLFRFLLLGGIVAVVISPSVGTAALVATGTIQKAQIAFTWWNWYVGDAVGVLAFAPLTLGLLNTTSEVWRRRRKIIPVPMLIAVAVVWGAFWGTSRWEKQTEENHLRTDGETIARRITDRLITHREVLASLTHFIEAIPDCSFKQFEQFTLITLKNNPDIFALSLNDVVTNEARRAYEHLMSVLSPLGAFRIVERDNEKKLVPAADRPEYVAVRYIVPIMSNRQAIGFDIASEPIRREAIHRARALNSMAVTAPIHLVQEENKHVGLLALWPLTSIIHSNLDQQAQILPGFAVAVLKIDQTIEIATRGHLPPGLAFELTDPRAPKEHSLIFRNNDGKIRDDSAVQALSWGTELTIGDRPLRLVVHTTSAYQQHHRSWIARLVGIAGLVFVALLQTLILGVTARTTLMLQKNKEIEELAKTLEAEVNLRTSELNETMQSYRNQFLYNSAAMLLIDPENRRIIDGNNAAANFYGYSRRQLSTMCIDEISVLPTEKLEEITSTVLLNMAKQFESQHRLADGTIRHVEDSASVITFGGRRVLHLIIHDITERKRAEEALHLAMETLEQRVQERSMELEKVHAEMVLQDKMASMGQLAAGIAHEINTPMQFIGTNMEFLEEATQGLAEAMQSLRAMTPELPAPAAEKVQQIFEEADCAYLLQELPLAIQQSKEGVARVSSIVKAMKEFSHQSSGIKKNVVINSIIETTVLVTRNEWKYVANITTNLANDLPAVPCYIDELGQVLLNLIINAAQAIEEKLGGHPENEKGEITISTAVADDFIEIRVQDSGNGIPEDIRNKIFDPFFTTKAIGRGTGQGLTISHDVITVKHGGTLSYETEVGKGTTFIIRLPLST